MTASTLGPDLRVRTKLKKARAFGKAISKQLAAYEYINPDAEEGLIEVDDSQEGDTRMTQASLRKAVDVGTLKKLFDFELAGGPFKHVPSRNGRHVIAAGKAGQLSVIDRTTMFPMCDFTVDESVLDVSFLHNYTMFAAAQRKYTYIYDSISGAEVHCLKDQPKVTHLDFLPFHYLLVSWAENGIIRYLDTSTGQNVARHFSKMGPCYSLRQNASTGVTHVGHGDGCVSLWTPTIAEPVLKIRAHHGCVSALACHNDMGLVTGGSDGRWKVWDLRRADAPVSTYSYRGAPPSSIDVSQTGMVSVGNGVRVNIFSSDAFKLKVQRPYLTHAVPHGVNSVRFCPFEDLLLLGNCAGVASILVPGSGSGAFDSMGINPFETRSQRREGEVKSLIEKLRPDMISLPAFANEVGTVRDGKQEEPVSARKVLGKKQLKRRAVSSSQVRDSNKTATLGVANSMGTYDSLKRFR